MGKCWHAGLGHIRNNLMPDLAPESENGTSRPLGSFKHNYARVMAIAMVIITITTTIAISIIVISIITIILRVIDTVMQPLVRCLRCGSRR